MHVSQELRELKMLKIDGDVESLASRLEHEAPEVRRSAAQALGELGDPAAVGPLIATLSDQSWYVRKQAVQALGLIGDRRALVPLLGALKDEDWRVRATAAESLGQIGDGQAVPHLIEALSDERIEIQRIAAVALGRLGDPGAIDHLAELRFFGDPRVHDEVDEPLLDLIAAEDRRQWSVDVDVVPAAPTPSAPAPASSAVAHPRSNGHADAADDYQPATGETTVLVLPPHEETGTPTQVLEVTAAAVGSSTGGAVQEEASLGDAAATGTPAAVDDTPPQEAARALYRHANRLIAKAATDREVVSSLIALGLSESSALSVLRATHAARASSRRQSAISTITFGWLTLTAGVVVLLLTGMGLPGYVVILVGAVLLTRGLSRFMATSADELDQLLSEAAEAASRGLAASEAAQWRAAATSLGAGQDAVPGF